jgi:predicted extracellular nuclease
MLMSLFSAAAGAQIVISQVYGGGGNASAPYRNDYVELFNRGASAVNITGWSVQYTSATGTGTFGQNMTAISGSIPAGGYYLVQLASQAAVGAVLPAPDATGAINMSATAGKVIVANVSTGVACNGSTTACTSSDLAKIVDLVGYGGANFFEGSAAAPTLSNTTAAVRAGGGCTDTNVNSADFTAGAPTPRNSATTANTCSGSSNPSGSGSATPSTVIAGNATTLSATVTAGANPASTGIAVSCNLTTIGGSAAFALTGGPASFSASYTVPAATPTQGYSLSCTITDDQSRTGSFNIGLTVSSSSTPPTATGSASPSSVQAGNPTTLSATVTGGSNPTSTDVAASCNLTAIGGSAAFALPSPGFSALYSVPANTTATNYNLPCTVSDAQSRSSAFSISLTVTAPPATPRKIFEITGTGTTSPLAGQAVNVHAVVTAVRAGASSVKGFYLESLPADRDADPNTSEGLLVFVGSAALPACAVVGNEIQLDGNVQDFVSSTAPSGSVPLLELSSTTNCTVLNTGALGSLPAPVTIDSGNPLVPGGSATQARKWLRMRVSMPSAIVVGASLGNLTEAAAQSTVTGEFFVTLPGVTRPQHGPGILATRRPSAAAGTVPSYNGNPEVMRINTGGLQPAATPYAVGVGATVTGLSGVMDFNTSDGDYQLYTNAAGAGTPNPASPNASATPVPAALPSDLTIGSFNMERFYNDIADGNGAATLTTTAYQGRLNKASLAIRNVMRMPDIIGLEEVEGKRNSGGAVDPHVIDAIVAKVNSDAASAGQGNPNYTWCTGITNDPGAINVAVIYKQGKVQMTECSQYGVATQYNEPDGGSNFLNDRPPVTLKANVIAPGSDSPLSVRLVVNHLRSLNGIDEPGAGNGDQVRTKRNLEAKYLANLINGTSVDQSTNWNTADNLVVVGDFNAYHVNDGYVDVMNCITGNPAPANQQYFTAAQLAVDSPCTPILSPALTNLTTLNPAAYYSYVFSGSIQTLDHVLLNQNMFSRFRQLAIARNDAEFPEGPIYRNDFNRPERVSDHDMPVVYLRLPVEVTSRTRLNATAVALNRATGRYTSNISVTNTGAAPLTGPVYVFFSNLPAGVTLPDLPVYNGVPYATINLGSGLAPGATSTTVQISFADPTNARISYTTTRFDGTF